MRKLVCLVFWVLIMVSTLSFADVTPSITERLQGASFFNGDESGYAWNRNITRGETRVVLSKMCTLYDTKIETVDELLRKNIADTEGALSQRIDETNARIDKGRDQGNYALEVIKKQDAMRSEEISELKDRTEVLQALLQKTRDQLAYLIRGVKDEVREKDKSDADLQFSRPFYIKTEIASIGTNGNKIEAGYNYLISDLDYSMLLTPIARYDNGLSFLVQGQVNWGVRR